MRAERHLGRCQAYVESGSVATARGGRRYRQCRHRAITVIEVLRRSARWERVDEVGLCGTHLRMHDEGRAPRLESYERRRGT